MEVDLIQIRNLKTYFFQGKGLLSKWFGQGLKIVHAVDGVSLSIKAGQRVAIVGPSGSGKTTLVNMIPRFYAQQEGGIRLNGVPLDEYTLNSLRINLGLVSQDTFLFNTTVKENIAYAREEYDISGQACCKSCFCSRIYFRYA